MLEFQWTRHCVFLSFPLCMKVLCKPFLNPGLASNSKQGVLVVPISFLRSPFPRASAICSFFLVPTVFAAVCFPPTLRVIFSLLIRSYNHLTFLFPNRDFYLFFSNPPLRQGLQLLFFSVTTTDVFIQISHAFLILTSSSGALFPPFDDFSQC